MVQGHLRTWRRTRVLDHPESRVPGGQPHLAHPDSIPVKLFDVTSIGEIQPPRDAGTIRIERFCVDVQAIAVLKAVMALGLIGHFVVT